jgi:hypothetical protein
MPNGKSTVFNLSLVTEVTPERYASLSGSRCQITTVIFVQNKKKVVLKIEQ